MNKSLTVLPKVVPGQSLDAYLQAVNSVPMLTEQEEKELAEDLFFNGNTDAARRLVLSHLRFVAHVAKGYQGYGLPVGDLIQEGNVGLMKAVKRFDPTVGVRLVSFAVHWIKAEIHEYVIRNWRVVKIATTKAQRKLFFNLRSRKKQLGRLTSSEAEVIADELGVSVVDVREMEDRLSARDMGFDLPKDGDEDSTFAPAMFLEDHSQDPSQVLEAADWDAKLKAKLHAAIEKLDERSQDIINNRWFADKKATLHELAAKHGNISAERVRQLEANAMKKIKAEVMAAT